MTASQNTAPDTDDAIEVEVVKTEREVAAGTALVPIEQAEIERQAAQAIGLPTAAEMHALDKLLQYLGRSNIVPRKLVGKPNDIMVTLLYGRELGLPPMISMNRITVIEGTPSLDGVLQMALVRRAGHKIHVRIEQEDDGTPIAGIAWGKRKDEDEEHEERFTMKDAVQAGLIIIHEDGSIEARSRNDEAMPWEKYPKRMLRWRAVTGLCAYLFSDVLMGYIYTPEEAAEIGEVNTREAEADDARRQRREQEDHLAQAIGEGELSEEVCPRCRAKLIDFNQAIEDGKVPEKHPRWKCSNKTCHGSKKDGKWQPWADWHRTPPSERNGNEENADKARKQGKAPETPSEAAESPQGAEPQPEAQQAQDAPDEAAQGSLWEQIQVDQEHFGFSQADVLRFAQEECDRANVSQKDHPKRYRDIEKLEDPMLEKVLVRVRTERDWADEPGGVVSGT